MNYQDVNFSLHLYTYCFWKYRLCKTFPVLQYATFLSLKTTLFLYFSGVYISQQSWVTIIYERAYILNKIFEVTLSASRQYIFSDRKGLWNLEILAIMYELVMWFSYSSEHCIALLTYSQNGSLLSKKDLSHKLSLQTQFTLQAHGLQKKTKLAKHQITVASTQKANNLEFYIRYTKIVMSAQYFCNTYNS